MLGTRKIKLHMNDTDKQKIEEAYATIHPSIYHHHHINGQNERNKRRRKKMKYMSFSSIMEDQIRLEYITIYIH